MHFSQEEKNSIIRIAYLMLICLNNALSVTCSCMLWNITRNECIPKVNYGLATLSTAFKEHWEVQIDSSQFKNKHWTKFGKLLLQPTKLSLSNLNSGEWFYCNMDRQWCHRERPLKTYKWKFERSFQVNCPHRSCKYPTGLSRGHSMWHHWRSIHNVKKNCRGKGNKVKFCILMTNWYLFLEL